MLAEDNVPFNACVSDAVNGCYVATSDSRHHDTFSIVDDCCHNGEETEKYVDVFMAVYSSSLI